MSPRGRIRDDDIAAVRDKARIEEIVEPYTTLRKSGADSMKGLCPFHEEQTPSFHVTPSRGLFYCYGCQAGGDVIAFIQEIEGLGFPDAVRYVADRVGIELREESIFDPTAEKKTRIYAALEAAADFFQAQIDSPEAASARRELAARGFSSDHAADAGCGYSPADGQLLVKHLRGRGFTDTELLAAGLISSRGISAFFRGRLMWPIRDPRGRVAGFGARRLSDNDPLPGKYINSPETDVFRKSYLLYGLDQARRAAHRNGRVIVVEGYTDVMAYRAAGVEEVVASCGTAFGASHLSVLSRAVGDDAEIIFCFDSDAAGIAAAGKAWTAARDVLNRAYAVRLHDSDPCDYRRTHGDQALAATVDARLPLTRIVIDDRIAAALGESPGPEQRSRAASSVGDLLGQIPDDVVRAGYVDYAATSLGVSPANIPVAAGGSRQAGDTGRAGATGSDAQRSGRTDGGSAMATGHLLILERRILHRLAADPKAAGQWGRTFEPQLFNAPVAQAVCRAILAASGPDLDVTQMSPATWVGRLLDFTDPPTGQAISRLLSEPLPDDDIPTLMRVGKARLEEHLLTSRLAQNRAALAAAAGTAEEDVLLEAVVDLNAQLSELRAALDEDNPPT